MSLYFNKVKLCGPRLSLPVFFLLAACVSVRAAGGNAIDRLNFGNTTSETVHGYSPGGATSGTGSLGQTYRLPVPSSQLIFTMACDPNRQNYVTIKVWGNDTPCGLYLNDITGPIFPSLELPGGPVIFPNRFYYHTQALPMISTQGKTLVQIGVYCDTTTKKIYSAFTHTAPCFVPDPADATGTAPTRTGQVTLTALTTNAAIAILQAQRTNFFGSGKYLDYMKNRQIMPGTPGAPPEVIGLDINTTSVASWMSANSNATYTDWRNHEGTLSMGPGYSMFPDELVSVLTTAFLMPPFTNASGSVVPGLDTYHDTNLVYRVVLALDGASYLQCVDGGFGQNGSGIWEWKGLCSTPRIATSAWPGTTARNGSWGLSLEGVDSQGLGFAIINIMNDPVGGPVFTNYLAQSIDGDLNGGSMLRAYVYERMLRQHIVNYLEPVTGGTQSQNMFQELGMYACQIAFNKIQALYPNASYSSPHVNAMSHVNQTMGVIPDTQRGVNPNPLTIPNYGLTRKGFGESHGSLSTGFDGGGYGQILPWLAVRFALLASLDTNATPTDVSNFVAGANATINCFDQFLSPMDYATVNSSGTVTANTYNFSEETFITYRDNKNVAITANRFNFNAQFLASDPAGILTNAYALRSAYLGAQYGITPSTGASAGNGAPGGALNYMRDYLAYERTIRSLIGVNPTNLAMLPCEPGAPNFAWADVQAGAVAFMNNGERFFMNANWRNYEVNGGFSGMTASEYGVIHYTTPTIERTTSMYLPYNSAGVQSDGNFSSTNLLAPHVVRYGNYLIVLNNSSNITYNAKLPVGAGQAQELISRTNFYVLGSTIPVAPGDAAVFWLVASNSVPAPPGSPTTAIPAAASTITVTNTTVNLSVLGADDGGEGNLIYTWGVAGSPTEPVAFSANGSNAAKNTTATFLAAGTYQFVVIIKDGGGLTTNSSVTVTVNQTVTALTPNPSSVFLLSGQTQQFFAVPLDQFGVPMQGNASFAWSITNGVGNINSSGFYTAPSGAGGSAAVQATSGGISAIANVTVTTPTGYFPGALDIGPNVNGSSSYNYGTGTYTITASGNDIWGNSDAFRFICQPISGDSVIIARVVTSSGGKSGVMFRQSLDANAAFTDLTLHNTTTAKIESRASAGGNPSSASLGGTTTPYWLKLLRSGDVFTGSVSPDGTNWTQVGQMTVAMNDPVYVGLVECGNNNLRTATFDHVFVGPLVNFATNGTATASTAGSTAEGAAKAFDGSTGSKWYDGGTPPPGWLQYNFGAGIQRTVVHYDISSANDVQQRDPKYWQMLASNDDSTWTTIDTQTNQTFANRLQTRSYNMTNAAAYQYYRLNILTNSGGSGYGLQLSELTLLGYGVPATAVAPASLGANAGNATVNLAWSFAPGAMNYNLKRSTTNGGPYTIVASNLVSLAYTNTGLINGTTYYYVVSAANAGGESTNSIQAAALPNVIPAAPASLAANPGDAQVILVWPGSAGATNYFVKRSLISGGTYANIATNGVSLTFTNTGLNNGTRYYFVVSASNSAGEGANSVEASALPVSQTPPPLNFGISGNQLQFNWPADHLGWRLQMQTNSIDMGIGTNWVDVAGSTTTNQIIIPMDPANGSVFFRLIYP